mgnify:CR=1 FL=1
MCDASLTVEGGTYDGEYCDWEASRTVRVRKPHQCEVCALLIPPGHYAAVRAYGTREYVTSDYMHLACRSLWERVSDDGRQEIFHQETLDYVESDIDEELADTHRSIVRWSHGGEWRAVERGES